MSIDESRYRRDVSRLLTADEASRRLGVRKATLYTYASRGWIRAVREGRRSRYVAEDVEFLRERAAAAAGHGAAAASALDWGAPLLESALTTIDSDGPRYRGRSAVRLAEADVPFEAVFDLLVDGAPPSDPEPWFPPLPPDPTPWRPVGDTVGARLLARVAHLAAEDPLRLAQGERERLRCRALVRQLIGALAGPEPAPRSRDARTVGEALAHTHGVDPARGPLLSRALVVCADHELNASTFAARVAAGTGADTLSCVAAALAAWSGPRHGGATDRVERWTAGVKDEAGALRALTEALSDGGDVPGFGHRLYPDGDPRARALLTWAAEAEPARVAPLLRLAAATTDATGELPTLDFGLVALARALDLLPGGAAALFAVGRTAGWIAHVHEQRRSGRMLRPRATPISAAEGAGVGGTPSDPPWRPRR